MPAPTKGAETSSKGAGTRAPDNNKGSESAAKAASQLSEVSATKPDQVAYNKEQESIKQDIDKLQNELNAIKEKIGLGSNSKSGPGSERRAAIIAELDEIRNQQGDVKQARTRLQEQVTQLQENISKKVKELQANKSKLQFKTIPELDAHVKKLEAQVEGGNMKLVDEKRALQEISTLKRQRRTLESSQADQEALDSDKARVDELRKELNDPESKARSERWESLQKELDQIKKEADDAYNSRSKLYDQRSALQQKLDEQYALKRESAARFRENSDRYWAKVNEDKARRAERMKVQRAAQEEEKRREIAEKIREEADALAYQFEIEDCQTLIDYFSGAIGTSSKGLPAGATRSEVAGVPQLELRKVEDAPPQGVQLKKKGEEEVAYFVGGKGKKKGGKGGGAAATSTPSPSSNDKLNIPFAKLSALMSLSIPPPVNSADIPQTIENLRIKKEWFIANQTAKTEANKAEAEKEIARLLGSSGNGDATPGEKPAEEDGPASAVAAEAS